MQILRNSFYIARFSQYVQQDMLWCIMSTNSYAQRSQKRHAHTDSSGRCLRAQHYLRQGVCGPAWGPQWVQDEALVEAQGETSLETAGF
jgi:hypothetical protein